MVFQLRKNKLALSAGRKLRLCGILLKKKNFTPNVNLIHMHLQGSHLSPYYTYTLGNIYTSIQTFNKIYYYLRNTNSDQLIKGTTEGKF